MSSASDSGFTAGLDAESPTFVYSGEMKKIARILLIGPMLLVVGTACDSANPVAPPGTSLTVVASPSQISLTGTSTITVRGFKPDGNPLNPGTVVIVTTDLGTLVATNLQAGSDGTATTTLVADGRPGTATITVVVTTGGDATASTTVQVGQTAESRPTLVMTASPTTINVGGESIISILGRNADNTPVGSGNRIRLTADLGMLVPITGDANSEPISEATTDSNGEAQVKYIAGDRSGQGSITAILGTSDQVAISITINNTIESLSLLADRSSIDRVDGGTSINLTAIALDRQGNGVTVLVIFESIGSFSNDAVTTNSSGRAPTVLTVARDDLLSIPQNGTFRIRASATTEGQTREAFVDITVLGAP